MIGGIGLLVVLAVVLVGATGVADGYHPAVYPICGLVALLLWSTQIRPAVRTDDDALVLRNPLSTVRVPLAAIEQVVVRQWLTVRAADRTYTSAAVGRSRRQALRDDQKGEDAVERSYGAFVEARLHRLAEDARSRSGVELYSDEQEALGARVEREHAWLELGLAGALLAALVVSLLV